MICLSWPFTYVVWQTVAAVLSWTFWLIKVNVHKFLKFMGIYLCSVCTYIVSWSIWSIYFHINSEEQQILLFWDTNANWRNNDCLKVISSMYSRNWSEERTYINPILTTTHSPQFSSHNSKILIRILQLLIRWCDVLFFYVIEQRIQFHIILCITRPS